MRYVLHGALALSVLLTASLPTQTHAQRTRTSFQDHYADVNGVRLHYASVGQGPLVLFLHGYPSFWYQWKDQMLEMGRDHLAFKNYLGQFENNCATKENRGCSLHLVGSA